MGAECDIQKLIRICKKYKLNFWSRVFEEYGTIQKRLELDSRKNDLVKEKKRLKTEEGWENYSLYIV